MVDFDKLKAEFPRESISWRAQSVTKDGTKAMALGYVDARDVMNRLDEVCSPAGWQCKYSHANGKTVCDIGIKVTPSLIVNEEIKSAGEWVWKADGAGDSDIEAEKGALSDAFKRAAVRWGIGRYLYDLETPWVPCESYDAGGKFRWSAWKESPWSYVKKKRIPSPYQTASVRNKVVENILSSFGAAKDVADLKLIYSLNKPTLDEMAVSDNENDKASIAECRKQYEYCLANLKLMEEDNARSQA